MLHFDNAPIDGTQAVTNKMLACELLEMEYPPYNPDLTSCDFFFFGCIKEKLKGIPFSDQVDLIYAVQGLIEIVSHETRLRVFAEWNEKMQNCIVTSGKYQE
jgi:hypothetical protein